MGPEVAGQIGGPGEHLPTELAAVPVLGLVPPGQHLGVAAQPPQQRQRGGQERGGGHRVDEGGGEGQGTRSDGRKGGGREGGVEG